MLIKQFHNFLKVQTSTDIPLCAYLTIFIQLLCLLRLALLLTLTFTLNWKSSIVPLLEQFECLWTFYDL